MCGIAGIVSFAPDGGLEQRLARMIRVLRHRGPDGEGRWTGPVGGARVALGHLRLAILDLTPTGDQPMASPSGRQILIYNGEIYNYRELRRDLEAEGEVFRGGSDTEVALCALRRWGRAALSRFNGMWALAFVDLDRGTILLSRDRFGVKPLYLYRSRDALYWSSEIKGILEGSGERFEVDAAVAGRYLEQSLLDAQEETFFKDIRALPPGHVLELDLAGNGPPRPDPERYWTLSASGTADGRPGDLVEEVRELFLDAVRIRLRSDVPVGILLSGGLDSSCIAAAVHAVQGRDSAVTLFSAVADNPDLREDHFIDCVGRHVGRRPHRVRVAPTSAEAFGLLERVIWQNDEPVAGFSNVAQLLIMERARESGVTVLLSGQGADEVACGYRKYLGFHAWNLVRKGRWGRAIAELGRFQRNRTVVNQFRWDEARRYLPFGGSRSRIDIRGTRVRQAYRPLDLMLGKGGVPERQKADVERFSVPALVHYEDRMSMAAGREIRLPFLDYRLVSKVLALPVEWKLREGWTKWIFRKAMERDMPREIAWRKDKQGFALPEKAWLRGPLRGDVERMLAGPLLSADWGLVDPEALKRRYARFVGDGEGLWHRDIFNALALELWARRFEGSLKAD